MSKDKKPTQAQLDIQAVMSNKAGRKVISGFIASLGVFESSALMASFRTNETFFQEGRRTAGTEIMSIVNAADPDNYKLMMKEVFSND